MTEILHLNVLGSAEASINSAPVTGFVSRKARALLFYLVVSGRPHNREKLAALLWGDMREANARTNLRKALSNLNKLLPGYLTISRWEVAFNRDAPYRLDMEQLIQQVESVTESTPLPSENATALAEAIGLYRGDFLEECHPKGAVEFEEWSLIWRERLRGLAMRGLHLLISDCAYKRDYAAAIEYANSLLMLNPWREETHRQLMLFLARSGQRNAALAQYRRCQRILADELNVEPMAETTALYRRIQAIDPARRHNLPFQPTPFIGRKRELAELTGLLSHPAHRLLTIVGPGGIGKTRLALQAAAEIAADFLNGVRYISLSDIDSTELVVAAISDALDLAFDDREARKTQLLKHLRRADKEILLILDNFEQLLLTRAPAEDAAQFLGDILRAAPGLKILVTSREQLNLRWEQRFALSGLHTPPDNAGDALETYDATALFISGVRRVQHRFAPTSTERRAIINICQMIDGIPLAIELAAAAITTHSCRQIVREIERNLNFLASPLRDVPDRHKSLRATFRYSWNLLTSAEQTVFKKLAVFHGAFDLTAAQNIAGAGKSVLNALVTKSLLQSSTSGQYQLHQHLRQYAAEILQQDLLEQEKILDAHSKYFARFMHRQEAALAGGMQQNAVLSIAKSLQNIRSAWQWAVARRNMENINVFLGELFIYYDIIGNIQEGETLFAQGVAALQATDSPQAQTTLGRLLSRQGWFSFRRGEVEKAEDMLMRGLSLLQRAEDNSEIGFALGYLGALVRTKGNYKRARQLHQKSLNAYRIAKNQSGEAAALNHLGIDAQRLGNSEEAQRLYKTSLKIREQIGDQRGIAASMGNLGVLAYLVRDYELAKKSLSESLQVHRQLGEKFNIMMTLNNLGGIATDTQSYQEAKIYLEEALIVAREIEEPASILTALANLGVLAAAQESYKEAWRYLHNAFNMALEIQEENLALEILAEIMLLQKEEQPERALETAAFLLHYPAVAWQAKQKAQDMFSSLESQLSPQTVAEAQNRGQTMDLDKVVVFDNKLR